MIKWLNKPGVRLVTDVLFQILSGTFLVVSVIEHDAFHAAMWTFFFCINWGALDRSVEKWTDRP